MKKTKLTEVLDKDNTLKYLTSIELIARDIIIKHEIRSFYYIKYRGKITENNTTNYTTTKLIYSDLEYAHSNFVAFKNFIRKHGYLDIIQALIDYDYDLFDSDNYYEEY